MTNARQPINASWDEEDTQPATISPQTDAEEARRLAVLANWDDDAPTPAQKTYTEAEVQAMLAAQKNPRVGPEARALLKDFDNKASIAELAHKYELSPAAVRARIRASGRSVRRCPHCGGGL